MFCGLRCWAISGAAGSHDFEGYLAHMHIFRGGYGSLHGAYLVALRIEKPALLYS